MNVITMEEVAESVVMYAQKKMHCWILLQLLLKQDSVELFLGA